MRSGQNGFTLIELMIAVGIIALLAATAFSFYGDNVRKAQCTEGRSALMRGFAAMEKCKLAYGTYNDANCNTASFVGASTPKGHFDVTLANTATTFTITATGTGAAAAANNTFCPTITINHLSVQGGTGSDPW